MVEDSRDVSAGAGLAKVVVPEASDPGGLGDEWADVVQRRSHGAAGSGLDLGGLGPGAVRFTPGTKVIVSKGAREGADGVVTSYGPPGITVRTSSEGLSGNQSIVFQAAELVLASSLPRSHAGFRGGAVSASAARGKKGKLKAKRMEIG